MVEVNVEQGDLNYVATDFMGKRLDHKGAELPINTKKNQRQHKRKLYDS